MKIFKLYFTSLLVVFSSFSGYSQNNSAKVREILSGIYAAPSIYEGWIRQPYSEEMEVLTSVPAVHVDQHNYQFDDNINILVNIQIQEFLGISNMKVPYFGVKGVNQDYDKVEFIKVKIGKHTFRFDDFYTPVHDVIFQYSKSMLEITSSISEKTPQGYSVFPNANVMFSEADFAYIKITTTSGRTSTYEVKLGEYAKAFDESFQ